MSIKDPRIDVLRERFNALQLRKHRSSLAGDGLRFVLFIQAIERAERVRVRFARHAAAIESPITSYVRFLREAA